MARRGTKKLRAGATSCDSNEVAGAIRQLAGIELAPPDVMVTTTTTRHSQRKDKDIDEAHRAEAIALGHSWAGDLADAYRDRIPAEEWPDFWLDSEDGPLPRKLSSADRASMQRVANRAARERWIELVADQRAAESIDENESELEAAAAALEGQLRESLPPGISAGRDGSRAYIRFEPTAVERTVTSIEDAWRVIEEWTEARRVES